MRLRAGSRELSRFTREAQQNVPSGQQMSVLGKMTAVSLRGLGVGTVELAYPVNPKSVLNPKVLS